MRRIISLGITCILTASLLSGCSSAKVNEKDNVVHISILNSKPEIQTALEKEIEQFEQENQDITIKIIQYSQAGSYRDKMGALCAAGNAPTLTLVDASDISTFSDVCLELSNEKWVNDVTGGISEIAQNANGEVIAFPFATEGAGFIYNKKLVEEAGIDINKINTIQSLEEAFKKVNAIGKDSLIITNEEWSLGDHFLSTAYAADSKELGMTNKEYFEKLKGQSIDIMNSPRVNGLLDTFDVMKKYNIYSENPLAPSYDKCAEVIGSGQVAFWYNGNWASQNILAQSNGNDEFGFIPVPISNNASEYANSAIAIGITKYFIVNKEASEKQIEAAKRLLNYFVYDERGNKFLTEGCGVIPAFSNMDVPDTDPLVNEIIKFREEEKTIELVNSYLPANNSSVLGLALRKYLNNEISRDELRENIQKFWKQK